MELRNEDAVRSAALAVVLAALAGCAIRSGSGSAPPRAAAFFEPEGPLRLMEHRPVKEEDAAPFSTANVRTSVGSAAPRVPDSKLRLDVGMKLESSELGLGDVEVRVRDQRIHLSGEVSSLRARDRAELLARSVTGVATVRNAIRLEEDVGPARGEER